MKQRFTMEDVRVTFLVVLLCVPCASDEPDLQNIYPGCKKSPDQPDMSYPSCDRREFLQDLQTDFPVFSEFHAETSRLGECFTNYPNYIFVNATVQGSIEFNGPTFREVSFPCAFEQCVCIITLLGPPGAAFAISSEEYNNAAYDLHLMIYEGHHGTYFSFQSRKIFNTLGNDVTVELRYSGDIIGALSFRFAFYAVPDCSHQLDAHCFTTMSGYIETPDWGLGGEYVNDMDSCVTLHVPENHVTMISFINFDAEEGLDYLLVYKSSNCSDGPVKEIRLPKDLRPTVMKDAYAWSFRFHSDSSIVETGFRLLYSFHNASEEPRQLSDGKWECNVSYFDSFRQHFMCVPGSFCSDDRNKGACPDARVCGSNVLTIKDRCYRLFGPPDPTTWNKASVTCASYGGNLAVLNTAAEQKNVIEFLQNKELKKPIFIGLRFASTVRLHDMYQNTWLWTDDTLAVYLPITFNKAETPYCAAVYQFSITAITCNREMNAAFLCETDYTPDVINDTAITLSTSSGWNTERMTTCGHDHLTHNFLACDVRADCLALNKEEALSCSRQLSPPVPYFTCKNQVEHMPYTLVCDFRSDCCDDSDEDFCEFPACDSGTQYECADSKQCIHRDLVCNKRRDCVDESDELRCQDSLTSSKSWANTVEPPARVDFSGDGNFNVVPLTNTTCPETHFQCPGGGYCLPVYTRCNEFYDCPGKEDEMDCDHYTCPGFYRCRGSKACVHEEHLCDGVNHCPENDDELMCNLICPESCHCYGHAFICTEAFTTDNYTELRYVDASGTMMKPNDFFLHRKLIHLSLKYCGITTLSHLDFPNLQSLDLSYNDISELSRTHFRSLKNLVSLSLASNLMMSVYSFLHTNLILSNVINVDISGIAIPNPTDTFFNTFPKVQLLNMSRCGVKKVTERGFQSLRKLHTLDIRGCPLETFYPGVFEGLNRLEVVYTDNYKLCCPTVLPVKLEPEYCHAPTKEISSCDALLGKDIYRVFLTVYAVLALTGNLGSLIYRVCIDRSAVNLGYEIFVTHLSVANFLMGVYLAITGIADRIYYEKYRWHDEAWRHSVACKLAGFLSLGSTEVSAFLICLITLERFLVIGLPHKNLRFNRLSAHVASVTAWLIGLILALVPLLPMTSHWNFYSQTGICIPLPTTRKRFAGSDYAFGVMIVVNFVLFLFIAVGQLLIYWSIHVKTVSSEDSGRKARDTAIARRLLAVVMTDFICWFPVGVLGLMARSGVPISSEINVAIAIFVLPFNSALNPFLYAINIVMEKRRKVSKAQKSRIEGGGLSPQSTARVSDAVSENRKTECNYSKEEAFQLFKKLLANGLLTPEEIRRQIWEIYEG